MDVRFRPLGTAARGWRSASSEFLCCSRRPADPSEARGLGEALRALRGRPTAPGCWAGWPSASSRTASISVSPRAIAASILPNANSANTNHDSRRQKYCRMAREAHVPWSYASISRVIADVIGDQITGGCQRSTASSRGIGQRSSFKRKKPGRAASSATAQSG